MTDVKDFLKTIPKEERLKYVTKGNIDYVQVAKGEVKELNFTFPNRELELSVTAGQILPPEI
ncbi:MAG: hypothetical protein LBQ59_00710 [Candidatus Peribacteria bacterium]|jgi:hypothetical protein|nr:hypothetical protein [Candidatus Peribacteria bacterium]